MKELGKTIVYGVLDLLTARRGIIRVINNEPIRFPARYCRYYPADYERDTFAFLRSCCKAGATVLDIGAHIGLYTLLLARLVGPSGKVYSFEPTANTRSVLTKTVALNGLLDVVEIRAEAVSHSSGVSIFYETGIPVSNANSLIPLNKGNGPAPTKVKTVSLDDFVAENHVAPDCVKIDVEGAELEVLRGGRRTFLTHRPAVALALHPAVIRRSGGSLHEIWRVLKEVRMTVMLAGSPVAEDWFCQQENLFDVQLLAE